ncbi:hypothetical protein [Geodermatophilus amargosae]|nr:hypothetical protein [Geodermatophilus amargosae]
MISAAGAGSRAAIAIHADLVVGDTARVVTRSALAALVADAVG